MARDVLQQIEEEVLAPLSAAHEICARMLYELWEELMTNPERDEEEVIKIEEHYIYHVETMALIGGPVRAN
jgi:hypothetical protein